MGQTQLLHNMALKVNEDIKSRVTFSTILKKLNPEDMETFILKELDAAGLAHNIFTENALALIIRSSDGILRKARNLCLSCMVEAVRTRHKTIDIDNVNRVLIQPHWRIEKEPIMCNSEDEMVYEEKLDKISEYLEEMILDAFLSVIQKIIERNIEFNASKKKAIDDGVDF